MKLLLKDKCTACKITVTNTASVVSWRHWLTHNVT